MNIDNLTLAQVREIVAMFGGHSHGEAGKAQHPAVGKYVIARCYAAGVHAGYVLSVDGENVTLRDSVRLWSWKANNGVALSGVAQAGVDRSRCRIDMKNPVIYLTGVCELIPCSDKARETIDA